MTLSPQQVRKHVMDYLEATECSILEVSPLHVTVKLTARRPDAHRPALLLGVRGTHRRRSGDVVVHLRLRPGEVRQLGRAGRSSAPGAAGAASRPAAGLRRAQEATLARQRWKPARTARRPVSGSRHPQGRLPLKQIRRTAFSPATSALCRYCRGSDRA